MKRFRSMAASTVMLFSGFVCTAMADSSAITLAVANSTCTAIKKVGGLFEQQNNVKLNYICKSSGRLAKGLNGKTIEADVYISANRKWIDYMIEHGLIKQQQVTSPWGNRLVVAAKKNSPVKFEQWQDLESDQVNRILIGDPGTAPFGRYAKQAMQSTQMWNRVKNKIETKKHITLLAETLASENEGTVGILFESNVTDQHRVLFVVDSAWHPPVRYYMGPVKEAAVNKTVQGLIEFIQTKQAKDIFRSEKFIVEE